MTKPNEKWRETATHHAQSLEWQAAMSRLMAMAESPDDAIAVAADLTRAELHAAERRRARRRGERERAAPAPISKLLTEFADALRTKLVVIGDLMGPAERARLQRLAPAVTRAIEDKAPDVIHVIGQIIPMEPEIIALWLRMNLDILEKRFAS